MEMREKLRGLYVIIDPEAAPGRDELSLARDAIEGGARLVQLRDKGREKGLQLPVAEALARLCRERGVPFIVNDHVDLALVAGADGVHLGQHDLPAALVRTLVPATFVVGVSTNTVEEARCARDDGASYVAVGSIYPTGSKAPERTRPASIERLREVKAAVDPSTGSGRRLPVVAIGGINQSNIDEVIAAGADAVAVISAVCAADDPREAAQRLAERFER